MTVGTIDIDAVHRKQKAERGGSWMQTYSGVAFWPLDPHVDEILLEDIAHSLSLQCRFAGHTRKFYSVAQHSVLVAKLVPEQHKAWGLLHDASEAYLVDFPRPVKNYSRLGDEYKAVEKRLMDQICRRFGLPYREPACIKDADLRVLMAEAIDLLGPHPLDWGNQAVPMEETIMPCDYKKYHPAWKQIVKAILRRADGKCELCNAPNHVIIYRGKGAFWLTPVQFLTVVESARSLFRAVRIVLTVHHVDYDVKNNKPYNLLALCQRCHNKLDMPLRIRNRRT